jgi:YVTN family beta-propeller protein
MTAPHPYGLAISRDGRTAVTANSGVRPFSFTVIDDLASGEPVLTQIPPGGETDEGVLNAVFMGLAFLPDGSTLVAAGGNDGTVMLWDIPQRERLATIDCDGEIGGVTYDDSYTGDLALTEDGRTAYVCDQANFRVVVVDVVDRVVVGSVPVGRYPFGISLSPDGSLVYVANVGMYEYSAMEGYDGTEDTSASFPPFGVPSEEAERGTVLSDGTRVPGLGDPNVPESFSVWTIDARSLEVVAKVKTGVLVGEEVEGIPAVGGSSPNSIAVTDDYVFVSNGSNDSVSVISTTTHRLVMDIPLRLHPAVNHLRGLIPFGVALDPSHERLYVAAAGINAVAVIDTALLSVQGYIPTAWFPSKLAVAPDGKKLVVACAKGFGSGSSIGVGEASSKDIGGLMRGVVQICDIPSDDELRALTRRVVEANFVIREADAEDATGAGSPIPTLPGVGTSPIKHVVYIVKENRTFDQVYGDFPGVDGDPSLARYGAHRRVVNRAGSVVVEDVTVMPNHRRLAAQYALSQNFYCDSDHSADGHRWLVGVYPNEWVETGVAASYGGRRPTSATSSAPGRLAIAGASGAIYPEDYNEAGSIWEHLDRHGVTFYNFGLGFEFAGAFETQEHKYTGVRIPVNYPMPQPLFERTSREYATYNTNIPDQFRVDMFEKALEERWLSGAKPFPQLITMMLPNDHGASERPDDGYPFMESYMMDNDLALGRVVETLSRSPWWKDMVIIVTEDDAQGGFDHVDAHRSLLLVIGPWAKKGYVSNTHANFGAILKTVEHILGMGHLNQYDGGASLLSDMFTDEPDDAPYAAVGVHPAVFDPAKALDPLDEEFDWSGVNEYPTLDSFETLREQRLDEEDALERR